MVLPIRFIIIILFLFLSFPFFAFAQPSLLPPCVYSGNCGLCDIIDTVGKGIEFLFFFLGASMFVVFVFGAWELIHARGRTELVSRGREMIEGSLWGGLFVLIAWQIINLVLFILGTPAGQPSFSAPGTVADAPEQKQITFNLFGRPWNYLCEPGIETGYDPANVNVAAYNQSVCFSRGDGSPCEGMNIDKTTKKWGVCENQVCGRLGEDVCAYLATTAPYQDYFKGYSCLPSEDSNVKSGAYECDKNIYLCMNTQNTLCCGPVTQATSNPLKGPAPGASGTPP